MKFIAFWTLKANADPAKIRKAMGRRADWRFPEGVELIAEYWTPAGNHAVTSIFEADDATSLMMTTTPWADVFHAEVFPCEDGATALDRFRESFSSR